MNAPNFLRLHTDVLYRWDERSRIIGSNQFSGGAVPRFHLARSVAENVVLFHADLADEVVEALADLSRRETVVDDLATPPEYHDEYLALMEQHGPIEEVWMGPAFRFAGRPALVAETVAIHSGNQHLLERFMSDWLPDVGNRYPFMACIEDGNAVAICASARMGQAAHEAGVEVVADYRQRGLAKQVVSAWANAVFDSGAQPLYSTSWDNTASLGVAASLGLDLIGVDFWIR